MTIGDAPTSFTMSNLKRKDAPGGNPPAKSAKNTKEARPTKKENVGKDAKPAPKKSAETAEKAPVVSLLKEDEPMFPRGGASVLTPLEQKKIQLEAKADAMRDEEFNTGNKVQKKKKRKTALKGGKKSDKKTGEEEQAVRIESLSFKVTLNYYVHLRCLLTLM
ncbi:rRNA biogenesis protein rrp5 [Fusarium oxysporum]|nr:rRNA biogenesis protein rrp5 [Fusarium oxysporum]KAJ4077301.1 rRNA biogenesis protein rrp5 [Fusarium oxysporum]